MKDTKSILRQYYVRRKIIMWATCIPIIIALIVGVVIGNRYAYFKEDTITSFLSPPIVTDGEAIESAREEGQALSNQIVREGTVLVKNEGGILPLSYNKDDASKNKVNVFGWNSIDWVFGGSGSGQVFEESDGIQNTVGILEALTQFGVSYNEELAAAYRSYHARVGDPYSISAWQKDFYRLYQPTLAELDKVNASVRENAKAFSDTALVVISRRGGETEDPTRVQYKWNKADDTTRTYLEISTEEEELLTWVGTNFAKVVVLVNTTNVMELTFLDTIEGLDACMIVGATGTKGAEAIPSMLYGGEYSVDEEGGEVFTPYYPSGKAADTWAYDMESNVNYLYSGDTVGHYTGANGLYPDGISRNAGQQYTTATYVDYVEGIYVGYKWYETADKMGVWNNRTRTVLGENGASKQLKGYESVVQFPFGFGLSYTTFEWTVNSFLVDGAEYKAGAALMQETTLKLDLTVTNTGEYHGKDVVEVFVTAPYYSGGIEKAYVSLVGFAKTQDIAPGETQIVQIELDPYDFTSYDCYDANGNGFAGYELEEGDYEIKLMSDAHTVKTVTYGGNEVEGVFTLNVAEGIKLRNDKVTGAEVKNLFTGKDAVEAVPVDGSEASVPVEYISRAAFPDPYTMTRGADRAITAGEKEFNLYSNAKATEWDNATTDIFGKATNKDAVTWGSGGNLRVAEANGTLTDTGRRLAKDYNDPLWETLLDQVTFSEAKNMIINGGWSSAEIFSIGRPKLADSDGPAQVRSFNAGNNPKGTGFPCSATMCQSWSPTLVYSFGLAYGKEMTPLGLDGVYGFGCNMHRSPFAGRNYEYLSEDAFLSGVLLTQEVRGLKNTGKYTYLKHLALGECEHDREAMYTWLTEQSLREIYLKPFQMAIQEGGCVGLMSSYNRIGSVWTGGSEALITGIVRNEWGFHGGIVTDYADHVQYMNADHFVRAGGDIALAAKEQYGTLSENAVRSNPRLGKQVREVVHHMTYLFLSARYTNENYNADEDVDAVISRTSISSWVWWKPLLTGIDIVFGFGMAVWLYFVIRPEGGWGKKED